MRKENSQSGNVLFLILIAVALFAALSFAVTQSTRSGSDTGQREQSLIGAGAVLQYPNTLRTALMRMTIAGTDVEDIVFDAPGNTAGISERFLIFDPAGGAATYQQSPADVMSAAVAADWRFNAEFHVPMIGTDGARGNDVIAFLVGVSDRVCERINRQMGIPGSQSGQCNTYNGSIPVVDLDNAKLAANMVQGYNFPAGPGNLLECQGSGAFRNKDTGCFYDPNVNGGKYVVYAVIMER